MTDIQKKYRGDTLGKTLYFKDEEDILIDPDTITITIKDQSGATIDTLSKGDLSKVDGTNGTYEMKWNIPADATYGIWKAFVKGTITEGNLQNTEPFLFHVQEMK